MFLISHTTPNLKVFDFRTVDRVNSKVGPAWAPPAAEKFPAAFGRSARIPALVGSAGAGLIFGIPTIPN
jgi:hypothetical protein